MSKSNRRDFLKASAVAGAAVSAGGLYAAAGNDVIKVGLIGCGGRGTGAIRNILDAEAKINGKNPKLEITAASGHSAFEPENIDALVRATDAFAL